MVKSAEQPGPTAESESLARFVGAFDQAALDFSRLSPLLWDPIGLSSVAAADLQPGQRVLDACCGDGASAVPAARTVGPSGQVDAVDLSPAMVELVRRRAAGLSQLSAVAADVTAWPGEGYDAVLCVLGAFFFPDMNAGTQHLVRCARPQGTVVVTFWRAGAMVTPGMALARAVAAERGEPAPESGPNRLQELGIAETFSTWLTSRGLTDVRVVTAPHTVPAEEEPLWLLVLGSGFRGMLTGFPDDAVSRIRRRYLDQLLGGPRVDATTLIGVGQAPPALRPPQG